jgi:hypothetical protein
MNRASFGESPGWEDERRFGRDESHDDKIVDAKGTTMYWALGGLGAVLYFTLLFVLGVSCLRKGHWVMFILGIFVPLFWIIGAVIPPVRPQAA